MMTVADLSLKVIDFRVPNCRPVLDESTAAGNNLLLIVPQDADAQSEISDALQLRLCEWLKPLDKTTILSLILHLQDEDFYLLREAHLQGAYVCLIEQLMLPQLKDPLFELYLVYCQIRGVISRHRSWEGAKRSWSESLERTSQVPGFPEPVIFHWEQPRWIPEHRPRENW